MNIKRPTLSNRDLVAEVANRSGASFDSAFNILSVYFEITKECLENGVDVKFGDLGVFRRFKVNPRYNHCYYNLKKQKFNSPVDVPGYYTPKFYVSTVFKKQMRTQTAFWDEKGNSKEIKEKGGNNAVRGE